MRISTVHIENYKNISFAYGDNLPNLMVVGGANGSGKTAFLEAIYTVKEAVSAYDRDFKIEQNVVPSLSKFAKIRLGMEFSETDKRFAKDILEVDCPDTAELFVQISPDGSIKGTSAPHGVRKLLSSYSQGNDAPGFFDYYLASRRISSTKRHRIDFSFSEDEIKQNLTEKEDKYGRVKNYLASLRVNHLQLFEDAAKAGKVLENSPLLEIERFFDDFFRPLVFKRIDVNSSPIKFCMETPNGEIDIDDLSAGEKEIFNAVVRFHELNPSGAIILFDEPDLHLHPDFSKRFLSVLETLTDRNQVIIATHSPEMMLGVDIESLYAIQKAPHERGFSQLYPVVGDASLYESFSNALGSEGIISFNKQVVYIEGEYSSTDIAIYEAAYPQARYDIKFVPARHARSMIGLTGQLNDIISKQIAYPDFYGIVDRETAAEGEDLSAGERIFRLPVYHAENFLIDEEKILTLTQKLNREKCPFETREEVTRELTALLLSTQHVSSFAKALADAKIRQVATGVRDAIYENSGKLELHCEKISFEYMVEEAKLILAESIENDTWRERCKGLVLLKAYCSTQNINYAVFRKLLIREMRTPHPLLKEIMDPIIEGNLAAKSGMPSSIPQKSDVFPIDDFMKEREAPVNIEQRVEPPDEHPKTIPDGAIKIEDYLFEFVEGSCKISGPSKVVLKRIAQESNRIVTTSYAGKYLEFFENAINGHVDKVRKKEIIDILGIPTKTKR
ncbi:MAG: AAA family ATPase [Pseudomonadota bacterium]